MKVIIVGGVAGGASCAARLRRLDEKAEIVMVERGPYVSYANCGLPYHVGGVIEKESSLLVADAATFRNQFAIDAAAPAARRIAISPAEKTVQLRDVASGEVTHRVLRQARAVAGRGVDPPAAARHRPARHLPGAHRARRAGDPRVDRDADRSSCRACTSYSGFQTLRPKTRAVVIGGGFIGLETAENLVHRGFDVTLVEMGTQMLGAAGRRDGAHRRRLRAAPRRAPGARRRRGRLQASSTAARSRCRRKSGKVYPADVVILALGVRPDTALAKAAGLAIGERGGIRVDDQMRTSQPDIFAVGDAVEVKDFVTGEWSLVALAGPGQPAGPHRRRRDRRARLALPRHAGHLDHRPVRRRGGLDRRQPRRRSSGWATPTSRRSTCSRTRMPATTPAPSRSR